MESQLVDNDGMHEEEIDPYSGIPLNPEENPPEDLDELDALIDKLQLKALDLKHKLDVVVTREAQNLPVDYSWVKRAHYAKKRTNYSISILQRISKQRRYKFQICKENNFQAMFVEVARENLTTLVFESLVAKTTQQLAAMN